MREEIRGQFPDGTFAHHGGHGLGIDGGEDPQLVPTEPMELEADINNIAGVVANGIFARRPADVLLLGTGSGVRTLNRPR